MKTFTTMALITLLTTLSGCVISNLSYVQVEPFAKPFATAVNRPLNLVLLEDVKDNLVVEGVGWQKMRVSDFRRSFEESMKNALEKNFPVINTYDHQPDTGLSLVIYRVKPFWQVNSQSPTSGTPDLVAAGFQFETSLFLDGKKLQNADLTVSSDDQMSRVHHAHPVFKNGLTKTCETINKEVFQEEIIKMIGEK